jgi:hypothetical protein
MIHFADSELGKYGLLLNARKTRIASKHGQQKVTGVVVNDAPRPPRVFRKKVRAMFHRAAIAPAAHVENAIELSGYLSYLNGFEEINKTKAMQQYKEILHTIIQHRPKTRE